MSPTEKIIDKLKKIHAMSEGAAAIGNEKEAQAFAEMFEKLLTRHKLDMSDIDFTTLEKEEPVGEHHIDFDKHPEFKVKKSPVQWQTILAKIVADAHYCQIVRFTGSNTFYLVGRKSDTEVAEYAIITLIRAADKIARKEDGAFYRKCLREDGHTQRARGYRDSFLLGFINRLKERYDEARRDPNASTSMALVRISRERKAVEDFMKSLREAGETRSMVSRKKWSGNREGNRRGREVADSVNLGGKAIKDKSGQGRLT
jgi:hypothetical protein